MMKNIFAALIIALSLLTPGEAAAGNITAVSVSINDVTGASRETFSSGERIALRQAVLLAASDRGNTIKFKFTIQRPSGGDFTHTGNEAPGTAGGAQSQIALSIASFYTVPGQYVYKAEATLGSETVAHPNKTFTISSPNITLIYPPYGARSLADKPLTFRWVGSGATRYRVTVSDNAGLYNALHTGTNSGESSYSYPENPTEPREQLVPDQVYYWKVEGLDSSNNVISESSVYNFSLKAQASAQSRNVTMSALELTSPALDFEKPLNFKATLYNSGSSAESNISIRFTLGGIPAQDSPKAVQSIGSGERQDIAFTAFMPAGQDEGLAVACADLFDDNMPDNCKTRLITKNAGTSAVTPPRSMTYDEMFQEILKRLGPDAAALLEGYTFSSLSCGNCSQDELSAIIAALISGDAQLVNAAVLDDGAGASSGSASASADAGEAAMPEETALDISPLQEQSQDEWSGFTEQVRGREPALFVIKSRKEWRRVWKTISSEDEPEVDFDAKMVAGIVSCSADRAQTVRLMGKRKTDDGIAFDYYIIEAPKGEEPQSSAYVFKVFDLDEAKAEFKRLDVK